MFRFGSDLSLEGEGRRWAAMSSGDAEARIDALEARIEALESSRGRGVEEEEEAGEAGERAGLIGAPQEAHQSSYLCARLSLLLVTLSITIASIFTFGPTLGHSYLNHIFIESLYPISLVAWTVHEHVYAGVDFQHEDQGGGVGSKRFNLLTLDGIHFLLSASTFFLCFSHCIVIYNWAYVVFQGVNGVASLLPFFFLPELRAALRRNAVQTHGAAGASDVAVSALKRGISVLSLMTFLLTEATGCIGLDSPAEHVPKSCQYAVIDNFILNHIAFLNLFDTVVVETGIARSRTALVQCRPSIPLAIRVCAAGAALLTIFCIGLFSTRYSVTLFAHAGLSPNTTGAETQDPFDGEYVPTSAALIAPLPMVGWMIITTIVFSKMGRYLRAALGQPPADFDRGTRPDARSGGAHTEMVSSSTSAAKGPSTYAVGAAKP